MDFPHFLDGWAPPASPHQERQALSRTLSCLGLGLLVFLLSAKGMSLGVGLLQRGGYLGAGPLPPEQVQLLNLGIYSLSLLLPILLVGVLLGRPARELAPMALPHPRFLLPALGLTLGVAAGINLLSSLLLYYLQEAYGVVLPAFTPQFFDGPLSLALTILSSAVMPAILEELLFRGLVLQSLRPWGDGFAVVVSGVLFALCHTTVGQWLPALVVGLCLGCFVVRSGSVLTGMVIHFVYNLLVTLVTLLGHLAGEEQRLLGTLVMLGGSLVACLVSYLTLSGRYGSVFYLRDRELPLPRWQRLRATLTNLPVVLAAAMLLYTTLAPLVGGWLP